MATAKLQTSYKQRAAEIPTENILPMLPDGRFVVIGSRDMYFTNADMCSCFDQRVKFGKYRQAIDAGTIDASTPQPRCKHILAVLERAN